MQPATAPTHTCTHPHTLTHAQAHTCALLTYAHPPARAENDIVYVTDLNSTNGTTVNGQELSPMDNVAVEVGSEVVFGERRAFVWSCSKGLAGVCVHVCCV